MAALRLGRGTPVERTRDGMGCRIRALVALMLAAAIAGAVLSAPASAATTPSGFLRLCKQAGPGVDVGETFDFTVSLTGVVRTVAIAAGGCQRLEVPRTGATLSKGYFRTHPKEVLRMLPTPVELTIDGQQLSAAEVQAVLVAAPAVSYSSPLLLNLVQQLLAADMNILRGVQPTSAVSQAVASANAGIQITVDETGEIELGTTLNPTTLSALVNTLTSFNEGKLKLPAPPASATLGVVESIPEDVAVMSIVCDPLTACSNVDLDRGSLDARVTAGATTSVTFTNRSTLGTLRLCKAAGTGITVGTTFRFLTPVGDRDVAAGSCIDLVLPEVNTSDSDGKYGVYEYGCGANCLGTDQGFVVASITCDPARCSSTSESVGTTRVGLSGGERTTVTFTNRSSRGTLRLCKAAGTGITVGTTFRFLTPVGDRDVAAGSCIDLVLPEVNTSDSDGKYGVYEYGCGANCLGTDQGFVVASITCDPARCSSTSESVGTTRVGLVAASTTTVTFTNRSSRGTLRLCKAAGTGITVGTTFRFLTPVGDRDVAAGSCIDLVLPEVNTSDSDGKYGVYEYGCGANCLGTDQGFVVASITCDPARCSSTSESVGTTRVGLVAASTTPSRSPTARAAAPCASARPPASASTRDDLFRFGRRSASSRWWRLDRASTWCCPP